MKRVLSLSFVLLLLMGCAVDNIGNNDEIPLLSIPKTVDDSFVILKNSELTISLDDVLKNDVIQQKTRTVYFDNVTANNGKIFQKEDGSYAYLPKKNFVGTDTFTYTVCNDKTDNYCSSAVVKVTIKDIITPISPEDNNDNTSSGNDNTSGNDDNSNNNDTDSNSDNNNNNTDYYKFNIPKNLQNYYKSIKSAKNKDELKQILNKLVNDYVFICYDGGRHQYLLKADQDKNNPNDVVLIYSGERRSKEDKNIYFNTEHVFPKSLLREAFIDMGIDVPKKSSNYCPDNIYNRTIGDLHHLRYCKANINSSRSNRPFTDGSGTYKIVNHDKWFPGDEWKGDVARMIFYMNLKYGCPFELKGNKEKSIGPKALFLKWNREDPVSDLERQRNNEIQKAQHNRNPFIDNPYLATIIYGGEPAEDTWK